MYRIILDTDPGIDDALALFLALASPEIQLEAITTVSGNVHVDITTRNALALLELAGRTGIPVARGSDRPLVRETVIADYVHGRNGLGEVLLPEPQRQPTGKHAVDVIIEQIMAAPGAITLIPIGPLTNIALAVRREPRIAQHVREVVIMGGADARPGDGRRTEPAAAPGRFEGEAGEEGAAGVGNRLNRLALTRAPVDREQFAVLAANGHPVTQAMKSMVDYHLDEFGKPRGITAFHMHDPLCLAAAMHPELLTWKPAYVDVELAGTLTLGESVAYFEQTEDIDPSLEHLHPSNVLASVGVDVERFIQLYMERIQTTFL